jgi:hypothetical protein
MLHTVAWVALVLSIASFLAFVLFGALTLKKSGSGVQPLAPAPGGVDDITRLIEALGKLAESMAKLTDSLAKAGPAIAALVASMVFLFVALVAAR